MRPDDPYRSRRRAAVHTSRSACEGSAHGDQRLGSRVDGIDDLGVGPALRAPCEPEPQPAKLVAFVTPRNRCRAGALELATWRP
jgi:hypothetical protein